MLARMKKIVAREAGNWERLALQIHQNPELGFQEKKTAELLIKYLASRGFKIEKNLAGLDTSFRAFSANQQSRPAVGFLAELDALPGIGHGCGHNLIAVSSAAAAVILRQSLPELTGSVEVLGCPAEERGGGKIILCNAGAFDHLDLAMLVHPSDRTEIYKASLALLEVKLDFIGRAAHAAACPEKGINALEAAISTFNRVRALRPRMGRAARVNGIILEGGKAPNIIPDRAKVEFWVRHERLDKTMQLAEMVARAGKSSAREIGARVKVELNQKMAYAPFLPNRVAGEILWEIFELLGIKVEQGDEKAGMGSTDLGNLSWRVPALHPSMSISQSPVHTLEFAAAARSRRGLLMMKRAALAMAMLGCRVMSEEKLRAEMKTELARSRRGK